jgi:hypothetical protein
VWVKLTSGGTVINSNLDQNAKTFYLQKRRLAKFCQNLQLQIWRSGSLERLSK